jgi:hypothetical protein
MTRYLVVAILLFFLLFFVYTETFIGNSASKGFYTDTNVNGAVDSLNSLNKKLADLKKTVELLPNAELTAMDALSSVGQVLLTKDSALYTAGVVTTVTKIKEDMDIYHEDLLILKEFLILVTNYKGIYQYDEIDNTRKPLTIIETIDSLTKRSNKLSDRLNKIPSI